MSGELDSHAQPPLGLKRWFQVGVFSRHLVIVVRLIDHGPSGIGLIWVADPITGRTAVEHELPRVPPSGLAVGRFEGPGTEAYATLPMARIRLYREARGTSWELTAHFPGHALELHLDAGAAPSPLLRKSEALSLARLVALGARGSMRFRSEIKPIEEASGFLEYGQGYFVRPLMWSSALLVGDADTPWAFVSDLPPTLADGGDNVVWEQPGPRALGVGALAAGPGRQPWTVVAPDGGVALEFFPRAVSTQMGGRGVTAMRHALVLGRFEGRLGTAGGQAEVDALGLCEARSFG